MDNKSNVPKWSIGVVIALVILVSGYILISSNSSGSSTQISGNLDTTNATVGAKNGAERTSTPSTNFSNGTYTSTGSYISPAGEETIKVEAIISNGALTSLEITPQDPDLESLRYQQKFIAGISGLVVGKKIDEAYVNGRVNGSSLTAEGFNNALDGIIAEAGVNN